MPWDRIAKRQSGVVAREQLVETGLTLRQIDSMVAKRWLTLEARGVYLVRGAPQTYESRLWVAQLATGGVLGFHTACHLWGVLREPEAPIVALVDEPRRITPPPGVRVRRRSAGTVSQNLGGLLVTPKGISVLDHLSAMPRSSARTLFDRALQQGWISEADVLTRLSTPRWGNRQLRELAQVLGDGAAARSERVLHGLLRQHDLQGWIANCPVVANGVACVLDVAFPEARLAIEIDGLAHHTDAARFQRDRSRQNALVAAGWRVLRFTWWDLVERPDYVIGAIVAQLRLA